MGLQYLKYSKAEEDENKRQSEIIAKKTSNPENNGKKTSIKKPNPKHENHGINQNPSNPMQHFYANRAQVLWGALNKLKHSYGSPLATLTNRYKGKSYAQLWEEAEARFEVARTKSFE